MRPGSSHFPLRSTFSISLGRSLSPFRKTLTILPSPTRTTASRIGGRPVPSIRTAPVKALSVKLDTRRPSALRDARRGKPLRRHADLFLFVQPPLLVGADVGLAGPQPDENADADQDP